MKRIFILLLLSFNANFAFGYITENLSGECGTDYSNVWAVFAVNEYTCNLGYFLPADTLGCQPCPNSATCGGGIFKYNESESQGIINNTLITQNQTNLCSNQYENIFAKFTVNEYACNPGYYLPAGNNWITDNDGCTLCPANSYCAGGTYTFNENVAQGAVSCASGLFAPTGMWESAQCGRILHIGDQVVYLRSVKKTIPSVNVDIDNDGVADYFGNMTTLDVPMTRGTQRKLKLSYGGQTYSVYDDSVDVGE